ncbi:MAG: SDR family oxidoreductase [Alphaproteobacteria bacterium]|nr:SDR family oxidoreductase [Alphaproteobacteria bacterium]
MTARILITGASRGIGAATARAFAKQGAKIGIHYASDEAAARRLAAECGDADLFQADLAQGPGVLMARFLDWAGGIDVLINNAGGVFAPDSTAKTMALNLESPIALIRAAWPAMAAAKTGSIVNVSSYVTAHAASPRLADYAVAKAGLEQATRNFAKLGAPLGIRVNAVRPGFVDTDLNRWADDPDRSAFAVRAARVPVGRAATAEEIAAAIVFLAGPMSSYTTGTVLTVAGGE